MLLLHSPGYPAHHLQPEVGTLTKPVSLADSSVSQFLNYGLRQAKLINQE